MSKGGVRGCRPLHVSIFYDPPKVQIDPPPREGLFDRLAGFWIFDRRGFYSEFFFWKFYLPTKCFSRKSPKSCNFSIKIGDIWKFATPSEKFLWPPNRIFYDPLLTRKSLITYDINWSKVMFGRLLLLQYNYYYKRSLQLTVSTFWSVLLSFSQHRRIGIRKQ